MNDLITCSDVRHWFDVGWTGSEGDGHAVIFCKACGDVRRLEEPSIEAPAEESIVESKTVRWPWLR